MTKLCPRGKAAAKRKFAVYPSAYANAYASKICAGKIKDPSGVKRKDFKGPKRAASGALINAKRMIDEKSPKPGAAFELRKRLTGKKIGGIAKTAGAQSALGRLEKSGMKMNKGGIKTKPKVVKIIGVGKAKNYPGIKKIIEMNKKGKKRFSAGGMNETIDKAKEFRKKSKQRKPRKGFERKYPGPARPGNPVVIYEVKKGGLTSELNNPAKGYTAGGMADYYKDLM
jgi:hypothetical protein